MGGPTAINPCLLCDISRCVSVSDCVHSREPNSRVKEASLNTIYLPTMANSAFPFTPCLHMWQFALRKEACKTLIWSDFHWFCSQPQHLVDADCSSNYHYTLSLQKLAVRAISRKFTEWHYTVHISFTFLSNQAQSLETDCPCGWCECEVRFMA